MNWDEATAAVQNKYHWDDAKVRYSMDWFGESQDTDTPDAYYNGFTSDTAQQFLDAFQNDLIRMVADAKKQAEQDYNLITNSHPFIEGVQYVQENKGQANTYTVVVTFNNQKEAEDAFNKITYGGVPFVKSMRYVARKSSTSFEVVVAYPLDY